MNPGQRILLVEDSLRDAELALHAWADGLASAVVHLHDGAQALDYLFRRAEFSGRTTANPAVVLLDLKMPKVGGLEVLRQIRAAPDIATVPVVIMTSSREERDVTAAYRLGANAYVVKPMQFADFVATVKQVGLFWAVVNEPPPTTAAGEGHHD